MVYPRYVRPAAHGAQPATPRLQRERVPEHRQCATCQRALQHRQLLCGRFGGAYVGRCRLARGSRELERSLTLVVRVQRGGGRELPQGRAGAGDRARQLLAHQVGIQTARLQQRLVRAHRLHGAVGDHPARAADSVRLSEA